SRLARNAVGTRLSLAPDEVGHPIQLTLFHVTRPRPEDSSPAPFRTAARPTSPRSTESRLLRPERLESPGHPRTRSDGAPPDPAPPESIRRRSRRPATRGSRTRRHAWPLRPEVSSPFSAD